MQQQQQKKTKWKEGSQGLVEGEKDAEPGVVRRYHSGEGDQ